MRQLKQPISGYSKLKKAELVDKILDLKKKGFPVPKVEMYVKPERKKPEKKEPAKKKVPFKVIKEAPAKKKKVPFKVVKEAPAKSKKKENPLLVKTIDYLKSLKVNKPLPNDFEEKLDDLLPVNYFLFANEVEEELTRKNLYRTKGLTFLLEWGATKATMTNPYLETIGITNQKKMREKLKEVYIKVARELYK